MRCEITSFPKASCRPFRDSTQRTENLCCDGKKVGGSGELCKLQLVLFVERFRSQRQLMEVVADRLSIRWYFGHDLHESLLDHSSLTQIRDRYGLEESSGSFSKRSWRCAPRAGLVWGEGFYFDATKVEAHASLESITPRFALEQHL
jgi:hypothetical protein